MDRNSKSTHFHHQLNGQNTPLHFNFNQENQELDNKKVEQDVYIPKEIMFEKPLTPSDVGRLNRLVIPKQHAEKYFPLSGGSYSVEKGILLSFEDESSGKTWQFRYSYWNSSQSYVITKGWSHFVKENRLVAGDIVVFKRFCDGGDRFFVGWKRQNAVEILPKNGVAESGVAWGRANYSGGGGSGSGSEQNQTTGSGHCKTLRLFGVNLECRSDEPVAADGSNHNESQAHDYQPHYHSNENGPVSKNHDHMKDYNFSTDVKKMRRFL